MIRTKEPISTVTSCITVNVGLRIKSSVTDAVSLVILLEIALAIYRTSLDQLHILRRIKHRRQPTCSMPLTRFQTNFGIWCVDSGCSNHMTYHDTPLFNIDRSLKCKVKMGTRELVQASGKGTLLIELKDGPRYIQEVMIMPGLDENLLSVGLENFGDVCEGCAMGKAHREAFDKNEVWKASQPLELVNSDVCGPMQCIFSVQMIQGVVELESGFQIKKLRTDRGGEYTSTEFSKFCEDMGLERKLTVAYFPQQNGVAERKNRTIVEMA
ncbi:hypothetical protein L3X38_001513 [Prunus dulcis]|uniref:Integrase catalytic domain-containing protein n=1 Tax=Prunus dulcis TaxID=3755 RepID=A0AAD4WST1_PRUDU|nr:hypothetical protein L3X38_001513 [Prunus dulcis]